MDDRVILAHATLTALEEAIAERLRWRVWYRDHPWTVDWPSRYENDQIVRALVKVARLARKQAAPESADPITAAKGAEDYWAGDHFVYDRDQLHDLNLEGEPAFNGAWSVRR